MPSRLHEDLLRLFQNRPTLAAELAREALHASLPPFTEARIDSSNLNEVRPTEYRADLVVLLLSDRPIEIGGDNQFKPWVVSPSGVPRITDQATARKDPELAVLSAVAHGQDADTAEVVQIASAAEVALLDLDAERSTLYRDILSEALSEAARRALQSMNPAKYEYRSEFAKRYYGQGLAEGRAELILKQLTLRFGDLPEATRTAIQAARIEELDCIGQRLLTAASLEEVLGKP